MCRYDKIAVQPIVGIDCIFALVGNVGIDVCRNAVGLNEGVVVDIRAGKRKFGKADGNVFARRHACEIGRAVHEGHIVILYKAAQGRCTDNGCRAESVVEFICHREIFNGQFFSCYVCCQGVGLNDGIVSRSRTGKRVLAGKGNCFACADIFGVEGRRYAVGNEYNFIVADHTAHIDPCVQGCVGVAVVGLVLRRDFNIQILRSDVCSAFNPFGHGVVLCRLAFKD